jgi:hypothetical protein
MILKTIDGREIETDDFKGYGQFKKYIQATIDPEYGKDNALEKTLWKVELCATKSATVFTTIYTEATTLDAAKTQALETARKLSCFDWREDHSSCEIMEIEITDCQISEDEE